MHVLQLALNVAVCRVSRYNLLCAVANCYLVYSYSERGMGELYAYLPHEQRNTDQLLPIPPNSIKHPDYGFSVGRGAWSFASGKWTRVLELVRVNTLGEEDGEFALSCLRRFVRDFMCHDVMYQARSACTSTGSSLYMRPGSSCARKRVRMDASRAFTSRLSSAVRAACSFHSCHIVAS